MAKTGEELMMDEFKLQSAIRDTTMRMNDSRTTAPTRMLLRELLKKQKMALELVQADMEHYREQ